MDECMTKTFKTVLLALLVGGGISVGSVALAQEDLGNYTLLSSKPGYDNTTAPKTILLSDMTPNPAVNISKDGKAWLKENTEAPTSPLSWETGVGKSYLIPALEIPAFLLLLNGYDRLAYPNMLEPSGKKPTARICQPSGTTSSMDPGGSIRTPSM